MEGSDPVGVIINHLGSKTFPIVRRGRGWGKESRERSKGLWWRLSTCTNEPAKWSFSGVWNPLISKVQDFKRDLCCWFFFFLTWVLKKKTEVSRWQKRPSGTGLHGCQFPGLSLKVLNTIFFFKSKYWLGKGGTPCPPLCICQTATWLSWNCLTTLDFSWGKYLYFFSLYAKQSQREGLGR